MTLPHLVCNAIFFLQNDPIFDGPQRKRKPRSDIGLFKLLDSYCGSVTWQTKSISSVTWLRTLFINFMFFGKTKRIWKKHSLLWMLLNKMSKQMGYFFKFCGPLTISILTLLSSIFIQSHLFPSKIILLHSIHAVLCSNDACTGLEPGWGHQNSLNAWMYVCIYTEFIVQ